MDDMLTLQSLYSYDVDKVHEHLEREKEAQKNGVETLQPKP